ncbi:MAG: hypothetical protein ACYC41_14215 [Bacillota bacterium]
MRKVARLLIVVIALILVLAVFTPQGAVRRYLIAQGEVFDALTVRVKRGRTVDFGGRQYYVSGYLTHHSDRMHLYFFYVRRTSLGICEVVEAGTGP